MSITRRRNPEDVDLKSRDAEWHETKTALHV